MFFSAPQHDVARVPRNDDSRCQVKRQLRRAGSFRIQHTSDMNWLGVWVGKRRNTASSNTLLQLAFLRRKAIAPRKNQAASSPTFSLNKTPSWEGIVTFSVLTRVLPPTDQPVSQMSQRFSIMARPNRFENCWPFSSDSSRPYKTEQLGQSQR